MERWLAAVFPFRTCRIPNAQLVELAAVLEEEGGVVGVSGGSMIFPGAYRKSETTFSKQN